MRYSRYQRHRRYIRHQRHGQTARFANITAKAAPTGAKVGGTVDAKTLFTVVPSGVTLTFTLDNDNATLGVDGFTVTYAKVGNVKVTATGGGDTASVTVAIAAA